MVHTLLMVVFVLVAIAMVVLILLQRGAGAQAGSGFGAGASGTVFGSRGSANFLSSSTKWLAAVFFSLSLFMAWQSAHQAKGTAADAVATKTDLGIMANLPADAGKTPAAPAAAAPVQALPAPAPASSAPALQEPVIAPVTQPATPVEDAKPAGKGG
jgi:preprotein translocase subunit SecG